MKKKSEIEVLKLVKDYLGKYQYDNEYLDYINNYFLKDVTSSLMTEIYSALDLYTDDNPYVGIADFIERKFSLNANILEIGCGIYPSLTKIIADRQKIIGGTITAYDPRLTEIKLENVKLYKQYFTDEIDLSKFDLIIAIKPCEATSLVINEVSKLNKDYIISPCDCVHFPECYEQSTNNYITEWYEHVYQLCELYKIDGHTYKDSLDKKYNYKYPLYTHKKL